jgi:hypothetical protein
MFLSLCPSVEREGGASFPLVRGFASRFHRQPPRVRGALNWRRPVSLHQCLCGSRHFFKTEANNSQCLCGSDFRKGLRHVNFIYLFPKWEIQGIHGSGEHLENRGRCAYLLLSTRASEKRQGESQEESTDFTAVPFRAARTPGLGFALMASHQRRG